MPVMHKTLIALTAATLLTGCQMFRAEGPRAVAELRPTTGNTASGMATFTQVGDKVRVHAMVSGLKPGMDHGFHVHEVGDCGSGDGMSTKGHFNPYGKPHAHFSTPERHAGDLPALKADAGGRAELTVELDVMTVAAGPSSVVGRGLIVHAQPDDYRTQPTGNAGARLACAVIRRAN
jgi:Cu-Zn family superoxide dismutase